MKNFAPLFLFFVFNFTFAQDYSFEFSDGAFPVINNGETANGKEIWNDDYYELEIGFVFAFFGEEYKSLLINTNGTLQFGGEKEKPEGAIFGYAADLVDFAKYLNLDQTNSPIYYQLEGEEGKHILKIAWFNTGFVGNESDLINFQIWLHEEDNSIKIWIGKNLVEEPKSAFEMTNGIAPGVGLAKFDEEGNVKTALLLVGNPKEPKMDEFDNIIDEFPTMDEHPPDGMVYDFIPNFDVPCNLSNLYAELSECDENGFIDLEVNFNYSGAISDSFNLKLNGGLVNENYSYLELPLSLGPFAGDGENFSSIVITDVVDANCFLSAALEPVYCPECVISEFEFITRECEIGTFYKVGVDFQIQDPSTEKFIVIVDELVEGEYNIADLPLDLSFLFKAGGITRYELSIRDTELSDSMVDFELPAVSCEMLNVESRYNFPLELNSLDGFLQILNPNQLEFETLSFYNLNGQLIKEIALEPQLLNYQVPLEQINSGLHLISLKNKDQIYSTKVLVR